jgi:3-oxoacyl-(acyl-carrier-protein) synthase
VGGRRRRDEHHAGVGCDLEPVWQALLAGRSGIHPIQRFDTSEYTVRFGGEVVDWNGVEKNR